MNTTPTTIDKVDYTVIGGRREPEMRKRPPLISIVLLDRAGRVFKTETLSLLGKLNAYEIISIEGGGAGYDVESMSVRFPSVRFIRIHNQTTEGEKINIGIEESESRYVLVLYDDMSVSPGVLSERLLEQISLADCLCCVPLIQSRKQSTVPTIMSPAYLKNSLKIVQLPPSVDGMDSLFPFDYCGIYDRELFRKLGGFDRRIYSKWWQKMDFGFRAHMWGERIQCKTSLRIKYLDEIPEESITPDKSYRFFYLKNLTVRFDGDSGTIPKSRFPSYHFKSGESFFTALKEFREAREWVETNKYRFRMEARSITEIWEAPEN
ncbi:MAG: hypothetical protein PQJ61_15645 [Spirochaetales bacterium]|uniref:Glycosyltransferase 2-like domain-containing protein n=1 Tax=Candidatus Thalassospirochaeta sargassi TaxID=3119039 RepID=A0AAJ1IJ48_9SPIO|nr:hypothetical protein [Spirochaetales bacterium]